MSSREDAYENAYDEIVHGNEWSLIGEAGEITITIRVRRTVEAVNVTLAGTGWEMHVYGEAATLEVGGADAWDYGELVRGLSWVWDRIAWGDVELKIMSAMGNLFVAGSAGECKVLLKPTDFWPSSGQVDLADLPRLAFNPDDMREQIVALVNDWQGTADELLAHCRTPLDTGP